MRRHVHLASIAQQKAIGFAVLVDEKLVHGPADSGKVIGIDPMHVEAPCVRLSGSPATSSQGACQEACHCFIVF